MEWCSAERDIEGARGGWWRGGGANGWHAAGGNGCQSTRHREFENGPGRGVRTRVVGPTVAAAAALAGCIVDVRGLAPVGGGSA